MNIFLLFARLSLTLFPEEREKVVELCRDRVVDRGSRACNLRDRWTNGRKYDLYSNTDRRKKRKSFGSKGRKKDRQMDRKRDNKTKRIMKRKWCNGSDMMFELKIRWPVRLKG